MGWPPARVNPSFKVSRDEALAALKVMRADPKPLVRPVVAVGGFRDPGLGPAFAAARVRGLTTSQDVYALPLQAGGDMDACRDALIADVAARVPRDADGRPAVVDVIGLSLGGLVARYAATLLPGRETLRVARLFSCGSPQAGARMAAVWAFDPKIPQMRPGSAFLKELASHDAAAPYELICYARLGDQMVGVANAAPPGKVPWWLDPPAFHPAHLFTAADPRVVADILRRLRGETPYTTCPPASLPAGGR